MTNGILTFDEILADPLYKSEFDRRVTKALSTVQAKLDRAQEELVAAKEARTNGWSAEDLQKKLDELQAKYDADISERDGKLADWAYSDAVRNGIAEHSLKFSSKGAKSAFISALKAKKLELKDGKLEGLEDFIKEQREADPDAFAQEKPAPKIVQRTGNGGAPTQPVSRAAEIAAKMNANLYGSPEK